MPAVVGAVAGDLEGHHGVPLSWFEVLLRLARNPERRLRMTDLAGQVILSTSGLTQLIDRMAAAGLVRRQACPSDRRGAYAALTPEGERALAAALPAHLDSLERHLVAPLGAQGAARLEALLVRLRDAARRP
jgi:MarR family transcriptional regulator, 2-MHQ and catechol-resistance regulon repressor